MPNPNNHLEVLDGQVTALQTAGSGATVSAWTAITFTSGWVPTSANPARFRTIDYGSGKVNVQFAGKFKNSSGGNNTSAAAVLPQTFAHDQEFLALDETSGAAVVVIVAASDRSLSVNALAPNNETYSLSGTSIWTDA